MKKWYQSKTIWGILIAGIGFLMTEILKVPEITLPANADFDQMKAYVDAINNANGNIGVIIGQIMGIVGAVLGIIGRIKADGKLV